MIPVAIYLLRQKTRPTNDEALAIVGKVLLTRYPTALEDWLSRESERVDHKMCISNLTIDEPVDRHFEGFIRSENGGRYLDHPAAFEVAIHDLETGDPPEPTKLALVFARSVEEAQGITSLPSDIGPFLARGTRWEELGRWGDAALCYAVALRVHGIHPELSFRLGRALTHHPRELARAVQVLEQAVEALPTRADVQVALGRCFIAIADHEEVPVKGLERAEVRRMGVARLEAAIRLDPSDAEAADELANQRRLLGEETEESFYDQ